MAQRRYKMAFRLFWRSAVAAIMATVAAKAGAVVPVKAASPPVEDRVAAIRAKVAELAAAQSQNAAPVAVDRPAQVAWNDWKNE
jgi:hypothetical protein